MAPPILVAVLPISKPASAQSRQFSSIDDTSANIVNVTTHVNAYSRTISPLFLFPGKFFGSYACRKRMYGSNSCIACKLEWSLGRISAVVRQKSSGETVEFEAKLLYVIKRSNLKRNCCCNVYYFGCPNKKLAHRKFTKAIEILHCYHLDAITCIYSPFLRFTESNMYACF